MSYYPGARKLLLPENSTQVEITPTQLIFHSIAAPWTVQRMYEYWRDSTNLESHFGVSYDGDVGQFISTNVRADANASANVRAISVETASNLDHTDPWTDEQVQALIRLGYWAHVEHGIPAQKPTTWNAAGMGYHRLFSSWSVGGTACPGDARVEQFNEVVLPGIQALIENGGQSPTPPTPPKGILMSEVLNSANANDYSLPSDVNFTGLAFGSDRPVSPAVLHGAGWKHDTRVTVFFDYDVPADTVVVGRFYLTDPDGVSGRSNFLDERHLLVGGGVTFHNSGIVPTGKHLRFEIRQKNPQGLPVPILHRLATGFYEVAG